MRTSTVALAFGIGLFGLPVPGTFVTGALVVVAALAARLFGA